MCITRDREELNRPDSASTEIVCGITSAAAADADPEPLLAWNRGHWGVEVNHPIRDRTLGEDDCMMRTGNGPGNRAQCRNIALAIIAFSDLPLDSVPQVISHCSLYRGEAFKALFSTSPARRSAP
ncbi:MAG: hypothetical protein OXF73_09585 [Gammaproteobacteria bacterium]|nr:hypothetical protein [Gammaproteobacteria bacterium]